MLPKFKIYNVSSSNFHMKLQQNIRTKEQLRRHKFQRGRNNQMAKLTNKTAAVEPDIPGIKDAMSMTKCSLESFIKDALVSRNSWQN